MTNRRRRTWNECKLVRRRQRYSLGCRMARVEARCYAVLQTPNGDGKVDQWSYFAGGIEVYRDIDADFNEKADQYRWLGNGRNCVGVSTKMKTVESTRWRAISAEEVTARSSSPPCEIGMLNRYERDADQPSEEINALGIESARNRQDLSNKVKSAKSRFRQVVTLASG